MVSDKLMKHYQDNILTTEPHPIKALANKAGCSERNLYRVLHAMEGLNLCEQVDLPSGWREAKKGWRLKNK